MNKKVKELNPYVKLLRNIRLLRAYPLTTKLELKIQDASTFHGYTIFFNNAHTIAHVMHPNFPDGYFRLKCVNTKERRLKQYTDDQLLLYFVVRLSKQLILE